MPTGYTDCIKDGISFRDFALRCARAMGACIMQRDESSSAPMRMDEPSDHYTKMMMETRKELAGIEAATPEEIETAYLEAMEASRVRMVEHRNSDRDLRQKYEAMLACVEQWRPPTSEHFNFQKFMRDQIIESINWDCDDPSKSDYFSEAFTRLDSIGPAVWHAERVAKLNERIASYAEEHAKELERCNQRNAWKRALLDSLNDSAVRKDEP